MNNKFTYLKRLVETYKLFTKWKCVSVSKNGVNIYIIWHSPVKIKDDFGHRYILDYTMRQFPKTDIGSRIRSYKDKIKREYAKRNDI